jgi:hypothetical protein
LPPDARADLRDDLSRHFVQRRRPDIAEWQDTTMFPDRLSEEITYKLTGAWGRLFNDVLDYARELVERAEGQRAARAAHELVGGFGPAALHLLITGRRR